MSQANGKPKHVAVLMGGWSAEREVSLVSGKACADALRQKGYAVSEIDVDRDIAVRLAELKPDVCFNALHGRFGEDGRIQGLLDVMALPYTHSGALASALAMDKPISKRLFAEAGLRCAEGRVAHKEEVFAGDVLPRPYVVKPTNEGSSVGVHIVQEGDNGPPFEPSTWPFGDEVMVETYIPGRELTSTVMGHRALAVTELRPHEGFYDYEAKYTEGKTRHICPAELPRDVYDAVLEMAFTAHQTLGCRGVSRSDFRYDDANGDGADGVYLLEINTQPGMTALSLVPEQARACGIEFPDLVAWMVEDAQCDA